MDYKSILTAAAVGAAAALGASQIGKQAPEVAAVQPASPTAPASVGCSTHRLHISNYSGLHPVDDGPVYDVTECGGKETERVEVK
jgi:hypothetical protein